MEEDFINEMVKKSLKSIITEKVDNEIKNEVENFTRRLEDRKDNYIAEIMKGIRIKHERDQMSDGINYRIIFENVVRLEK